MVGVQGFCDQRFSSIHDVFFGAGLERGIDEAASYTVALNGQLVVDLWRIPRPRSRRAWEAETVVGIASTSKVMVALATLMLWDRDLLDLDSHARDLLAGVRAERQGCHHAETSPAAQLGPCGVRAHADRRRARRSGAHGCHRRTDGAVGPSRFGDLLSLGNIWLRPGRVGAADLWAAVRAVRFRRDHRAPRRRLPLHVQRTSRHGTCRGVLAGTGSAGSTASMGARVVAELAEMVEKFEQAGVPALRYPRRERK